mmetsp:Transcript_21992/g.55400  ORF Transcript_21992/g.55400 Transcript_21992/m.55400 type:complete len:572 (-) Transcript_21992:90-1805(-)
MRPLSARNGLQPDAVGGGERHHALHIWLKARHRLEGRLLEHLRRQHLPLHNRKVFPNADTRATAKWHKRILRDGPKLLQPLWQPPLGPELQRLPPVLGAALNAPNVHVAQRAVIHQRIGALQHSVSDGDARQHGNGWEQPQRLLEASGEVGQLGVEYVGRHVRVRLKQRVHLGSAPVLHVRVPRQHVEHPRQRVCRGVRPGEQHSVQLVADLLAVHDVGMLLHCSHAEGDEVKVGWLDPLGPALSQHSVDHLVQLTNGPPEVLIPRRDGPREEPKCKELAGASADGIKQRRHIQRAVRRLHSDRRGALAGGHVQASEVVAEACEADDVNGGPHGHVLNVVFAHAEDVVGQLAANLAKHRRQPLDVVDAKGRVQDAPHLRVLANVRLRCQPVAKPLANRAEQGFRLAECVRVLEDLLDVLCVARVDPRFVEHRNLKDVTVNLVPIFDLLIYLEQVHLVCVAHDGQAALHLHRPTGRTGAGLLRPGCVYCRLVLLHGSTHRRQRSPRRAAHCALGRPHCCGAAPPGNTSPARCHHSHECSRLRGLAAAKVKVVTAAKGAMNGQRTRVFIVLLR